MKIEIILLLDKGFKPSEIKKMLGVSSQLVYYYNKRYKLAKQIVKDLVYKKANEK